MCVCSKRTSEGMVYGSELSKNFINGVPSRYILTNSAGIFTFAAVGIIKGLFDGLAGSIFEAISKGSSWVSGWWRFRRDGVRGDWLRGDLSIDPGASHVLVIPGEPLVADRRREMLRGGAPASLARGRPLPAL